MNSTFGAFDAGTFSTLFLLPKENVIIIFLQSLESDFFFPSGLPTRYVTFLERLITETAFDEMPCRQYKLLWCRLGRYAGTDSPSSDHSDFAKHS